MKSHSTEHFLRSIRENTLLICCNDFNQLSLFHVNPRITVVTAFANLVSPKNGFDEAWFRYHFNQDKITRVILAGHYPNRVIPFLLNDASENPLWQDAKKELEDLEKSTGKYHGMKEENQFKFAQSYIAYQLKWIKAFFYKTGINTDYKMEVSAIVIDQIKHTVTEIDDNQVLFLNETLN